ncbi:protein kinase [bacterium]|nr:protein kinase [bacterium]
MTREDEALVRILVGQRLVSESALQQALEQIRGKQTTRDLGSILLQQGAISKEKLATAQRLVKLAAPVAVGKKASDELSSSAARRRGSSADDSASRKRPSGEGLASALPSTRPDATVPEAPTPLMTPKVERELPPEKARFGQYEVVEKIAKGGMGVVYKVRHVGLDRLYALKVLVQGAHADGEVLERFRREAKTAARLDHPSIVRVHDAGTEDGFPYLVMDLIEGESLANIVRSEGVSPRKAALITRSIARALAHAHENGVVHRDVKPDNVLIDKNTGEPRLSDFGIVKDLEAGETDAKLTRTGLTLGSPCYMSPEQASGRHKDVGPCSDIYSLGATLYEMLAARPPFEGDSIHDIMSKVVRDDPVPPRRLNNSVHPELEAVCLKTLEKDMTRRYPTAAALADDIDRYLEGNHVLAKPAGPLTKAWRIARRNRAAAGFAAILLLLLVAFAANEVVKGAREHRERAERVTSLLQKGYDALASAKRPDVAELDARRAYREAMKSFELVLEQDPSSAAAKGGRLDAIKGLAQRLIARREMGFAEFVLDQLDDIAASSSDVKSMMEAARNSEWVDLARKAEQQGDLVEALRCLKEGLKIMQQAGLAGDALEPRIKELEVEIAARKTGEDCKTLIALAKKREDANDLVGALEAYRQALALDGRNAAVKGSIAAIEGHLRHQVEDTLDEADAVLRKALALVPSESSSRADFSASLELGRGLVAQAKERIGSRDFAAALDAARRAVSAFTEAGECGSALSARLDAQAARKKVESLESAKFANRELEEAKTLEESGNSKLAANDYARAKADFVAAATRYKVASESGSVKQGASAARADAKKAREAAQVLSRRASCCARLATRTTPRARRRRRRTRATPSRLAGSGRRPRSSGPRPRSPLPRPRTLSARGAPRT